VTQEDGFRTTFTVDLAPDQVWDAVARPAPGSTKENPAAYHVPGFEARCVPIEVDPGRVLRVRKDEEPCKGTEIVVVLVAEGSGTRITVVQSGFGPWLPSVLETFRVVWNLIVADLALYVERRISLKTHLFAAPPPRVSLGIRTQDRLTGLHVAGVDPGSFGERVGLAPGDLLLALNGVRLLYGMQLLDLARVLAPGNELTAVWARKSERMRGTARA
jgi:hypothetical protein